MTDAERPHRSRFGWPTQTEPTTTPAGTHSHKQSNGPLLLAFLCIVLLFLVNVGLVWFILARGEARDKQNCQLLDAFPAAPLLDQVRREFDCGPGRPVEDFPPDVQRELGGDAQPVAPPAPAGVEQIPELPGGAANVEPAKPHYPTPGVAEPPATVPYPEGFPPPDPVQPTEPPAPPVTPEPEPPPLVDLEPITDPICARLGVCI